MNLFWRVPSVYLQCTFGVPSTNPLFIYVFPRYRRTAFKFIQGREKEREVRECCADSLYGVENVRRPFFDGTDGTQASRITPELGTNSGNFEVFLGQLSGREWGNPVPIPSPAVLGAGMAAHSSRKVGS